MSNNVTCVANKLASEILWANNEDGHIGLFWLGVALTSITCVNIWWLMKSHIDKGAKPGVYYLAPRVAWTKSLLRLGIVAAGLNCAKLGYPEVPHCLIE